MLVKPEEWPLSLSARRQTMDDTKKKAHEIVTIESTSLQPPPKVREKLKIPGAHEQTIFLLAVVLPSLLKVPREKLDLPTPTKKKPPPCNRSLTVRRRHREKKNGGGIPTESTRLPHLVGRKSTPNS